MSDACAHPGLLSVAAARARLLAAAVAPQTPALLPLAEARGRVLAVDQQARVDVPPLDNSAMDGYALRLADVGAGQPVPVSLRIPAGAVPPPLPPGTAARIFTGAPLPAGAELVVMQEDCVEQEGAVTVEASARPACRPGMNVRPRGQDLQRDAVVVAAGTLLDAPRLGVLAAAGIPQVPVWPRLRVAFFSTGDELLEPGEAPRAGAIYNSNRPALRAWLEQAGCVPIDLGVVGDRAGATRDALRRAALLADLVITTGGASVGEEDHVRQAIAACGRVDLWKVAIKPGKPLLLGRIDDAGRPVPVLGLPGNPVSVAVTFLVLALPLVRAMQGVTEVSRPPVRLPSGFVRSRPGDRTEYVRVRLAPGDGTTVLEAHANQSSGVLASMAWADGFAVIPAGTAVSRGDLLEYLAFSALFG